MKSVHWQAVVKADNVHSHNSLHHEEENLVHQVFSGQDDCASSFLSPPPPHPRVVVVTVGLSRRCRAAHQLDAIDHFCCYTAYKSWTSRWGRVHLFGVVSSGSTDPNIWLQDGVKNTVFVWERRTSERRASVDETGPRWKVSKRLFTFIRVCGIQPNWPFVPPNLCPAAVVKHLHDDLWPPPLPVLRL